MFPQEPAGMRRLRCSNGFRRSVGQQLTSVLAAARPHVDDPVATSYDIDIVLDDHHGVARIAQAGDGHHQQFDVRKVQTGSRFIKNIERAAGRFFGEFACQLYALSFATGKGGCRLAQFDVAEANMGQCRQPVADFSYGFKLFERFVYREHQGVGNGHASIEHLKCLSVVAFAIAGFTGNEHVRQEVHLNTQNTITKAGLAATALDVKRKTSGFVTAGPCFWHARIKIAEHGEKPGVGRGVASRSSPDGSLIDADNFVDVLKTVHAIAVPDGAACPVKGRACCGQQGIDDQAALT